MAYTQISLDVSEGIALLTLNRPDKMNAFTNTMMTEIIDAMDQTDADDSVRAVIFTGAGERAFCAGADLTPDDGRAVFSDSTQVDDLSDPRVRDGGETTESFGSDEEGDVPMPVDGSRPGAWVNIGSKKV